MPVRVELRRAPRANILEGSGGQRRRGGGVAGHLPPLAFLVDFVNVLLGKPILLRDLEENSRGFTVCCPKWMHPILLYDDF